MARFRKAYRVKPKKKWWRNKVLRGAILICFSGGVVFFNLFFHQTLQVKEVKVNGVEKIAPAEIRQYISSQAQRTFGFLKTRDILLIPAEKIEENLLRDFPQIAAAHIKRKLPDTIEVIIEERRVVAVWCASSGSCFSLDKDGIVFEEASQEAGGFLLLRDEAPRAAPRLGERVISRELIEQIFAIKDELQNIQVSFAEGEAVSIEVKEAIRVSDERINIKTEEGWEIYFAFPLDLSWQMTRLKLLLKEEIPAEKRQGLEYIDLRFSKVYYRERD